MGWTDENGQAVEAFHARNNVKKHLNKFMGLAEGVIADGVVNQSEAEFIYKWLCESEISNIFPADVVFKRLNAMLADGVVDAEEQAELFEILKKMTGVSPDTESLLPLSTELPCTVPAPDVFFEGKSFCLTGMFAAGSRKECERLIADLGGRPVSKVVLSLDYLVIGHFVSRDWIATSYGTKIEAAVNYNRAKKSNIAIVPERHWYDYVLKGGVIA
ncbi:BRCT domain-containing protein [Seleniivibrio woodruffii]|uniref:BRCT domain-containing protein n=1 Tax=Seleniivibrio woodruffii TaxID=1078050 RepID=UPI002409EB32|nr:BRCT domain-containing protein [Seleniivibrio woodruffii]